MRENALRSRVIFGILACLVLACAWVTPVLAQSTARIEAESLSGMTGATDATCVGGKFAWYGASDAVVDMPSAGTWYVWVRYKSSSSRLLDVTVNGTVVHMPTTVSAALKWNRVTSTTDQRITLVLRAAGSLTTFVDSVVFTTSSTYDPSTKTLAELNALPVLSPVASIYPVRVSTAGFGGMTDQWVGFTIFGGAEGKITLPEGTSTWYAWIHYFDNMGDGSRNMDVTINGATTHLQRLNAEWEWRRVGTVTSRDVNINLVSSGWWWTQADSLIFSPSPIFDPSARSAEQLQAITEVLPIPGPAEQWLTDHPTGTTAAWVEAVRASYGYPSVNRVPPVDSYGNITYQGTPVFPTVLFGRGTDGTALTTSFGWPDQTWQVWGMENFHYAWDDYDHWAINYKRPIDPLGGRPKALINYIVDEPENINLSDTQCERLNDLVNMMDPNVATLINVSNSYASRGSLLTIPDAVALDYYPIDHECNCQSIAGLATAFDNLRYFSDIRPAIFIAQSFQWEATRRYPTPAEERAMVYLSLVHNARGLMWYTWPATGGGTIESVDPVLWADMKIMFAEIAQIIPCLQGPEISQPFTATVTDPSGGAAAEFRVAVNIERSQAVLLAVNQHQGGDWPRTVRLDFRGGPLSDVFLSAAFPAQGASTSQILPGVWDVTFTGAPSSGVFSLASSHLGALTQLSKAQVKEMLRVRLNLPDPSQVDYGTYGKTINITPGAPWTTNFGASVDEFKNSVYAVGGGANTQNRGPVYWKGPGNVQLCEYNWQYGSAFWKFHTDSATGFAGGKISLTFNYTSSQYGRKRGYVGLGTTAPTVNSTYGSVTWNPPTKVDIWGNYPGTPGYGTLARTVTLDLPAGQDFYFGVNNNYFDCSDIINLVSITIEPPPVQLNYGAYGNTINVPQGGVWSTVFGDTIAEFTGALYGVGGGNGDATKASVYWGGPGNVQLCDNNWKHGSIFYKFHTNDPGGFAGGVVTLNLDYVTASAGRTRGYVGVGATPPLPVASDWAWGTVNWSPQTQQPIWGTVQGNGSVMNMTVTLPLPAGQDAYFGVNTFDQSFYDVIWLRWLRIANSSSIDEVKKCQDGIPVAVDNAVVSASFNGYFYIETDDRSSGIRVNKAGYTIPLPCRVTVSGTVATINGERCINANTITPYTSADSVEPVGMSNRALGGGDYFFTGNAGQQGVSGGSGLNNIGLLVKTTGKVSNSSSVSFNVADGSGVTVNVICPSGAAPANGNSVTVIGISSCNAPGGDRLIRVRTAADIQ